MAKVSPLMILPPVIFAAFGVMAYLGLKNSDETHRLESVFEGKPDPAVTDVALEG